MTLVSVIIPLYNKSAFIKKTLTSVLSQTYSNFEIIVVDDGSTDNSVEIARKIDDPRIRILSQPNQGVAVARNKGIKNAQGELIAFLDADDEWKPTFLETQIGLSEKYPGCKVFAVAYEFKDKKGKITSTIIQKIGWIGKDGILANYFEVASYSHPPICSISLMVRKEAIEAIGGFPMGVKSGEDLLTWARLAARYKIAYSREPLAIFNVEGYEVSERPKRVPAGDDVVGRELMRLKKDFNPPHIDTYISHWHKMRSSIYMRLRMRRKSIREAFIGLSYRPANLKLYAFIMLNLLPSKLQPF